MGFIFLGFIFVFLGFISIGGFYLYIYGVSILFRPVVV